MKFKYVLESHKWQHAQQGPLIMHTDILNLLFPSYVSIYSYINADKSTVENYVAWFASVYNYRLTEITILTH